MKYYIYVFDGNSREQISDLRSRATFVEKTFVEKTFVEKTHGAWHGMAWGTWHGMACLSICIQAYVYTGTYACIVYCIYIVYVACIQI